MAAPEVSPSAKKPGAKRLVFLEERAEPLLIRSSAGLPQARVSDVIVNSLELEMD